MRIGAIGRSQLLLKSFAPLIERGHALSFIQTTRAEEYYGAGVEDFAACARTLGVPFFVGGNLRENIAPFAGDTDVAISVNWPLLLGREIRDAFRHGILNAHAGDLPRYRGNACPSWAILNFEPSVSVTIHQMTDELDSGPWLVKSHRPIDEETYVGDICAWLDAAIPTLFADAIDQIDRGGFIAEDTSIRPFRTFPRRADDGRILWSASTRSVLALIRASSRPLAGAFSDLEGSERVTIFRARSFDPGFDFAAVPGQICLRHGGNPVVATGDGMIEIEDCRTAAAEGAAARALVARSLRARFL